MEEKNLHFSLLRETLLQNEEEMDGKAMHIRDENVLIVNFFAATVDLFFTVPYCMCVVSV